MELGWGGLDEARECEWKVVWGCVGSLGLTWTGVSCWGNVVRWILIAEHSRERSGIQFELLDNSARL